MSRFVKTAAIAAAGVGVAVILVILFKAEKSGPAKPSSDSPSGDAAASGTSVELSSSQLAALKIEPVTTHRFAVEKMAVGSIDFDEDLTVQVFPSYQGKIITASAQIGDVVEKNQPLYTIESPDLIQAESTLIGAAATLDLTNKELVRAKDLYKTKVGVSERELEQATSDQQTAEGALKAQRDAVRVFGKSEEEIDQMVEDRKIDPALLVTSPVSGQVTSRNAQPGLLVQPGNTPAPYSVADVSVKWMLANIPESDAPAVAVGQPFEASVMALPGRVFKGRISRLGATVDPATHRSLLRSEILDPQNELRPGMLATFTIQVHEPVESTALPANGVVREGDGTLTAWVTTDRRRFLQRKVKVGLQQAGQDEIIEGLKVGELAVVDGAVFLSNILAAPPSD